MLTFLLLSPLLISTGCGRGRGAHGPAGRAAAVEPRNDDAGKTGSSPADRSAAATGELWPRPAPGSPEPGTPVAPADEPPAYAALKARIVRGDSSPATLKALQTLGARFPQNAEMPYLLGQLYFGKLWVGDGIKAFHRAIALDPQLRENPYLLRAVVTGLGNDRDHPQVRRFLVEEIGPPAAPYLEEALGGDWRQQVKERIVATLRELR